MQERHVGHNLDIEIVTRFFLRIMQGEDIYGSPAFSTLSNRNTNVKMKRWKAMLKEYNKPRKANVVADPSEEAYAFEH